MTSVLRRSNTALDAMSLRVMDLQKVGFREVVSTLVHIVAPNETHRAR